jgi:hypothetical protein
MPPVRLDDKYAAEVVARLWKWARSKALQYKDTDMGYALDVLHSYDVNRFLTMAHAETAKVVLSRPVYQPSDQPQAPPLPPPVAAPQSPPPMANPAQGTKLEDPIALLGRLNITGMLHRQHGDTTIPTRNGEKALSLMDQSGRWSDAQRKYATSLAVNIRDAALLLVAMRDCVDRGDAGRTEEFFNSLIDSYDTWGTYTPGQIEAARRTLNRLGEPDPLDAVTLANPDQLPLLAQAPAAAPGGAPGGPASDDDIPF